MIDRFGLDWVATLQSLGGPGSGNFGHAGRPGQIGGSAAANEFGQVRVDNSDEWNTGSRGEDPYGWRNSEMTEVPPITHKVPKIAGSGAWGYSHSYSFAITGSAAASMGIGGYDGSNASKQAGEMADRFLTEIANDQTGSEEPLYHVFQNVRNTEFKVGDTLRIPLTATAGRVGLSYGVRLDAEDQDGQPTVFVFEPGTQMMAYAGMTLNTARDLGHLNVSDAIKEAGHIWSEAIVAGGFEVLSVETHYMGSQHGNRSEQKDGHFYQIYGKVVRLRQTETFRPNEGWQTRG
jgi:hypothetical protein